MRVITTVLKQSLPLAAAPIRKKKDWRQERVVTIMPLEGSAL